MNVFQIIMLALGGALGVSTFWGKIKGVLSKFFTKKPDVPTPVDKGVNNSPSLSEVVVCWEHLQDELKKRGLIKAVESLVAIFPLFIEESKVNTTNLYLSPGALEDPYNWQYRDNKEPLSPSGVYVKTNEEGGQ
jgi:hypothetical protein